MPQRGGHLFCLQAKSGKVLWENKLSGLGYGACIIATSNQSAAISAAIQAQQAAGAAAATAASTSAATNG